MKRVIFVDDEVRILDGMRRMLRSMRNKWEMAFAPSGQMALDMMAASPFDVIVSDMRMPEMDGATLLEQVQQRYPETVRIVLSGHTEMAAAFRVVPIAHQFLAKPCDPETLYMAIERTCHLQAMLTDKAVRSMVGALSDLPALPRTYDTLNRALADPDSSLTRISSIIERDIGITAKILQLANSAFFGNAQPVANIQSAVGYLGLNTLKCLVLSLEVFKVFASKKAVPGISLKAMERHAQITAHIVARLPVPKHLAEVAVASAMLHDVGKLVQVWKLPESLMETMRKSKAERVPVYKVEEQANGFSHAEIGAYLLGIWGLPYPVVETVALHHAPARVPHQAFDAIVAVHVADLLAHSVDPAQDEVYTGSILEESSADLERMHVLDQVAAWQEMVKDVPDLVDEERAA